MERRRTATAPACPRACAVPANLPKSLPPPAGPHEPLLRLVARNLTACRSESQTVPGSPKFPPRSGTTANLAARSAKITRLSTRISDFGFRIFDPVRQLHYVIKIALGIVAPDMEQGELA